MNRREVITGAAATVTSTLPANASAGMAPLVEACCDAHEALNRAVERLEAAEARFKAMPESSALTPGAVFGGLTADEALAGFDAGERDAFPVLFEIGTCGKAWTLEQIRQKHAEFRRDCDTAMLGRICPTAAMMVSDVLDDSERAAVEIAELIDARIAAAKDVAGVTKAEMAVKAAYDAEDAAAARMLAFPARTAADRQTKTDYMEAFSIIGDESFVERMIAAI